jgi:DNA primase
MADDDKTVVLTYRELAERLGIKPASAKARALRNRWRTTAGNDGLARVAVPVSALERPETTAEPKAEPPSPATPMLTELLRQIVDAQAKHSAELERVQRDHAADLDQLRSEHGATTAQLRQDHDMALVRQAGTHQAEIVRLQQAHEAEAARLMLLIEELRRPWWRRWWKG